MIRGSLARIHWYGMLEQARKETHIAEGAKRRVKAMAFAEDVFRYAFARLGSHEDAEDVAMEVVQAALADRTLAGNRLLMLRNARNRVIDRLRKRREVAGVSEETPDDRSRSDVDLVIAVNRALALMEDDQADVLVLKYVHGLTAREICKTTGRTRAAVNSSLQRARERFRQLAPELRPDSGGRNER